MEAFSVREIPLDALRPAPWNANEVPPAVLAKVRASIEDFGVVENLVVRPPSWRGRLRGHLRQPSARALPRARQGNPPVSVVNLDDARAQIVAQTLNRTRGEDNPEKQARLMEPCSGSCR